MVIKYPNFNKFPSFLTTTDTDNNLLIDLVDRAKTADSVNWSGVNIDADKDMGGYSLSNITSIKAKTAYIINLMQDLNMNNFSISGVNTLTAKKIINNNNTYGVRPEILQLFDNPQLLANTCNMKEIANNADQHIEGAINVSTDLLELVGGTATARGWTWIYWNLPENATKMYIKTRVMANNAEEVYIEITDADASTLNNPPNIYQLYIKPPSTTADFRLIKNVGGTALILAIEAVDLDANTYYDVELFVDVATGNIKAYRDGVLKFNITDTSITTIKSARIRVSDYSTTAAQSGYISGQTVIIYE